MRRAGPEPPGRAHAWERPSVPGGGRSSAVSSLYPVATIALGVVIRRLRPARIQVAGITLALIGTVVLGFATG